MSELSPPSRSGLHPQQFQTVLVELARTESVDLKDTLTRLSSAAASALEVARTSIWLFNGAHTELLCLHLFNAERGVATEQSVLDVARYPAYFATLEQSRTIAAEHAVGLWSRPMEFWPDPAERRRWV